MKSRKGRGGNAAFLAPLYLFTLVFLIGPFIYLIVLSFLTRAETWGIVREFTVGNYLKILKPIYLNTFAESLKLALIVTGLIVLVGYPFGYFMAKLPPKRRGRVLMLVMIPFYTSSLMRMYGWIIIFRANGLLDKLLMALHVIERPLKLLYTYPSVVVGMVYALLPFMMLSVYTSVEKIHCNASADHARADGRRDPELCAFDGPLFCGGYSGREQDRAGGQRHSGTADEGA